MTPLATTSVLIPALNEEAGLPAVLGALPAGLHSVVVADNGSTDATPDVARAAGAVVVDAPERGYGAACLAGLAWLRGSQPLPEVVVFMDADHPEDAGRIDELLAPLSEGADLVLGVRTDVAGGTGNLHAHARLGNRLVLAFVSLLFGRRFEDLPPFRAVRLDVLEALHMDDRNWGWTLQMQLRGIRAGIRMVEIQVPHFPRAHGKSKISGSLVRSVQVGAKMFSTIVRERLR